MFQSFCIICQTSSVADEYLRKTISEYKIQSCDVFELTDVSVGISQVRQVIAFAGRKPFASVYKMIHLNGDSLTAEAQQALLKILEEPPESTLIYITAKSEDALLATILSRCVTKYLEHSVQTNTQEKNDELQTYWEHVLQLGIGKRLFESTAIAADRAALITWLTQQAIFFQHTLKKSYTNTPAGFTSSQSAAILRALQQAFTYTHMNVNLKLITDDLLLKLPRISER